MLVHFAMDAREPLQVQFEIFDWGVIREIEPRPLEERESRFEGEDFLAFEQTLDDLSDGSEPMGLKDLEELQCGIR